MYELWPSGWRVILACGSYLQTGCSYCFSSAATDNVSALHRGYNAVVLQEDSESVCRCSLWLDHVTNCASCSAQNRGRIQRDGALCFSQCSQEQGQLHRHCRMICFVCLGLFDQAFLLSSSRKWVDMTTCGRCFTCWLSSPSDSCHGGRSKIRSDHFIWCHSKFLPIQLPGQWQTELSCQSQSIVVLT